MGSAKWILAVLIAWWAACQPHTQTAEPVPEIPELRLEYVSAEARKALREAWEHVHSNPTDPDANGRLGMTLHAFEQYRSAIACYSRAAALDPGNARWKYYLGLVYAAVGEDRDAAEWLRKTVQIEPQYTPAWVRLAERLLALGELAKSQEAFEEAIERDSSCATAYYGLGQVFAAQVDFQAAVNAYQRAWELAPEAGATRYRLALAYRSLGEAEKAQPHFAFLESGNRRQPETEDPWMDAVRNVRRDQHWYLQEGVRLEAKGDLEAAKAAYKKAIEVDSAYAKAHVNLISVCGKLGQFAEAERHYHAALELDPGMEELHGNWGTVEALRDRPAQAAKSFRRALKINPHAADTHADLAVMLQELGKREEAVKHLRLALEQEPDHRLANFHLGRRLVLEGRVREGIQHLLKTREPEDFRTPGLLYTLADAYVRAGETGQGLAYARKAESLARRMSQHDLADLIQKDIRALQSQ